MLKFLLKTLAVIGIVGALVYGVAVALVSTSQADGTVEVPSTIVTEIHAEVGVNAGPVITEDDPRWDCATMGNKICGPGFPK